MTKHMGLLIGFCGAAGAGKSTAAIHLVRKHGFVRRAFAGPLKDMLRTLLACRGATPDEIVFMIDGGGKEKPTHWLNGATPRLALQLLGTEFGRALSPNLWTSAWRDSLPSGAVVCDDVRFTNEAALIRDLGGVVVRVVRPGLEPSASVGSHASERGVFDADAEIVNDDIDEFIGRVAALVSAA